MTYTHGVGERAEHIAKEEVSKLDRVQAGEEETVLMHL